jgi:hypothetical protein
VKFFITNYPGSPNLINGYNIPEINSAASTKTVVITDVTAIMNDILISTYSSAHKASLVKITG